MEKMMKLVWVIAVVLSVTATAKAAEQSQQFYMPTLLCADLPAPAGPGHIKCEVRSNEGATADAVGAMTMLTKSATVLCNGPTLSQSTICHGTGKAILESSAGAWDGVAMKIVLDCNPAKDGKALCHEDFVMTQGK